MKFNSLIKRSLILSAYIVGLNLISISYAKHSCFANISSALFEDDDIKFSSDETKSTYSKLIENNQNEKEKNAKIERFKQYIIKRYEKLCIKAKITTIEPEIEKLAEELYLKIKKFVEQNDGSHGGCFESFYDKINNSIFGNKSVKVIKSGKNFDKLENEKDIIKLHASFKNSEAFEKFLANDFSCTKFETPFGHGIYATDYEGAAINFALNKNDTYIDKKNLKNYNSYEKSEKPFNGIVSVAFNQKTSKILDFLKLRKIQLAMLYLHPDMFDAYKIFDDRYNFNAKYCDFGRFYSRKEKLKSEAFKRVFNITLEDAMYAIDPDHKLDYGDYDRECYKLLVKAFKNKNFVKEYNEALENDSSDEPYTNNMFAAFIDLGLLTKLLGYDVLCRTDFDTHDDFTSGFCKYNFVNPEVLIVCGNEQNEDNNQIICKILTDKYENGQQTFNNFVNSLRNSDQKKQTTQNKPATKNLENKSENKTKNKTEDIENVIEMLQTKFKKQDESDTDEAIKSIKNIQIKQERGLDQTLRNFKNYTSSNNIPISDYPYDSSYNQFNPQFSSYSEYYDNSNYFDLLQNSEYGPFKLNNDFFW